MASPYQQQALRRKLIYIGLIVALFTVAWVFRFYVVEARARELALDETGRGDVDLSDRVANLSSTGFRGLVVSSLWYRAMIQQKKNQWNDLEQTVRTVAMFQPHFITPWLFQSWNLSYNVSVECDRESDQYFYISRGIELLGEGEKKNHYQPEMRYFIGFYHQNKLCQGDKQNVLMSLFALSCIDPNRRDPRRFRTTDAQGRPTLNKAEFEKFCQENPQLVRRLRERVRLSTPEEVVAFLTENHKLPALFVEINEPGAWEPKDTPRKPAPERFPLLPDPHERPYDSGALTSESVLEDHHDAYAVGRSWYSYAQEAIPDPDPEKPGHSLPIADRTRQRLPKMTTLLFRHFPSRSQTYVAQRLEREGWFDEDGWTITGWFEGPAGSDRPLKVGSGRKWAEDSWREAHEMWRLHGERNGLLIPPQTEVAMRTQAELWVKKGDQQVGQPPREMTEQEKADDKLKQAHDAFAFLYWNNFYRGLSNFAHFYHSSEVEMQPKAIMARKRFFNAERLLGQARRTQALEEYEKPDALRMWHELMEKHPDFRKDGNVQEEAYETQHKYLELYRDLYGRQLKQRLALQALLAEAAGAPPAVPAWSPLSPLARPQLAPDLELHGPLDDVIGEQAVYAVKLRLGLLKSMPQNMPPGMMPPGQQPPGGPGGTPPGGMPPGGGPPGQRPPGAPDQPAGK